MITLTLLELLYLVLIFFGVVIGTLITLILIRLLKILGVLSEITGYYWTLKKYSLFLIQTMSEYFYKKEEVDENPKNPVL